MHSVKYDLKFFLPPSRVELEEFIPIFHRWVQTQPLDELLIDVADYRHVLHGPGVVLVAHDALYAMDMSDGKPGLLYSRRRQTHPSRRTIQQTQDQLASVFSCALTACQHLEAESALRGRLRFRGDELLLRVNDRLLIPTPAAYNRLRGDLEPLVAKLYPDCRAWIEPAAGTASRLTVVIKASDSPAVETLLERLGRKGDGVTS